MTRRFGIVGGDINGFLGLVVDNLSVLSLLAAVLIGGFGIPSAIVFGRMFPGTAVGVLIGDVIYTGMAVRLARRTRRSDVTAMPFGLDTPSTIGMVLLVLGPAFLKYRAGGLDVDAAGLETWYLGMAAHDDHGRREDRTGVHRQTSAPFASARRPSGGLSRVSR